MLPGTERKLGDGRGPSRPSGRQEKQPVRAPVYALLSLFFVACSVEGYGETSEEIGAADDALIGGQPALESQYPSTVVGLSLSTLRDLVRELGADWPSLWNRR